MDASETSAVRSAKLVLACVTLCSFGCGGGSGGGSGESASSTQAAAAPAASTAASGGVAAVASGTSGTAPNTASPAEAAPLSASASAPVSDGSPGTLVVRGSVGDGPVVSARVELLDSANQVLAATISDDRARYELAIPADATLPLTLRASGGLDLVTGAPLDFTLISRLRSRSEATVNLLPLTTLQFHALGCSAGASESAVAQVIEDQVGLALTRSTPRTTPLEWSNSASLVYASEAVAEWLRRVFVHYPAEHADEVVSDLSCELMRSSAADTPDLLARSTLAAVMIEYLTRSLKVSGSLALERMDSAIDAVLAEDGPSIRFLDVSADAVEQLRSVLLTLQRSGNESTVAAAKDIYARIEGETPADTAAILADLSGSSALEVLADPTRRYVPVADTAPAGESEAAAPRPTLYIWTPDRTVTRGARIELQWSSRGATSCLAQGAWSGSRSPSGSYQTGPILSNRQYGLTCTGPGGRISRALDIAVAAEGSDLAGIAAADASAEVPEGPPRFLPLLPPEPDGSAGHNSLARTPGSGVDLTFSISDEWVKRGGSARLTWSSEGADSCTASGGWSGPQPPSGSRSLWALKRNQTFSLACTDGATTEIAMVRLFIRQARISWEAPRTNTDGSPLTDLAGYRLYIGNRSGTYRSTLEFSPAQTETTVELAPGTHYFAVKALNAAGVESEFSDERSKAIR